MNLLLVRLKPPKETIGLQHVMICEPLELEYAAAMVTQPGVTVQVLDMILEKRPLETHLKEIRPHLVGFTGYITHVNLIREAARQVKALLPHCGVVVGGVHGEVLPEDFHDPAIDVILESHSLSAFQQLVTHLLALGQADPRTPLFPLKSPLAIQGIHQPGTRQPKETSFDYPLPLRQATAKYRHRYHYLFHRPCALMKTSFGCPYQCTFCFCRQITGGAYFTRPLDSVVAELLSIEEEHIYIVDDDFLVSHQRVLDFCQAVDEKGIRKRYLVYGRADFISRHPEVIRRFRQSGLEAVIVGLESSRPEDLDQYHKQTTLEENERAVAILHQYQVVVYATLILDPAFTPADFRRLGRWLRNLSLVFVNLQPLTPLRGTPLYDSYRDQLTEPEAHVEKWDLAHLVLQPAAMSRRRFYLELLLLYIRVTLHPRSLFWLLKRYGLWESLRLSRGSSHITRQYLVKILRGH
ncbi:B12-binding domain-containing radical SAM protein [Anoxynatronum buryatiense]|uniref:Radical SAM superfamily enzyme YgiQ, UPF0313 family n=1 Tax=Anoxynatronum buryatiense TaxID=489973 RepID=A0AA45WXZ6_9CLOT|nr:B12-binding domain-containing radical SAM protein [Anoxynatronum buryatiense]SMP66738.1 Radical SAM superfamily enzyme YgiQ, UPF0313 family [Anoxynatronum buryatiense]